jgi:hypothetical protein
LTTDRDNLVEARGEIIDITISCFKQRPVKVFCEVNISDVYKGFNLNFRFTLKNYYFLLIFKNEEIAEVVLFALE